VTRGRQREAEAKLELAGEAAGGVALSAVRSRAERQAEEEDRELNEISKISGTYL